jgi:hypothetical protein
MIDEGAAMQQTVETQEAELDPVLVEHALGRFREEQSLVGGVLAGLAAAVAGAALWAVITVATGYQIGWMAVGVGFLVGFAVRRAGKGLDKSFGVAGALLALVGCLLGNFLTVVHFVAEAQEWGYFFTLTSIDPAAIPELMTITFSPMDLLFYALALYQGYKLSFREITREELERAMSGAHSF